MKTTTLGFDKPLDQITQQDCIEAGQVAFAIFNHVGCFGSIADYLQYFEDDRPLIFEALGRSFLTYLKCSPNMPFPLFCRQIDDAFGISQECDHENTIAGQFGKQLDLFNKFLNQQ